MHLFMATEMVAGIVKANYVFAKNPSQHMADLYYLINDMQEYHDISRKTIDCIRVDGASDEGPWHAEVQFLWTE